MHLGVNVCRGENGETVYSTDLCKALFSFKVFSELLSGCVWCGDAILFLWCFERRSILVLRVVFSQGSSTANGVC